LKERERGCQVFEKEIEIASDERKIEGVLEIETKMV